MKVRFFGTYNAARHPRVTVLSEGLAGATDVDTCNESIPIDTAARVEAVRRPWRLITPAFNLARQWMRLWRRAKRMETPDVVVVGYLGILDVHLARLLWRRKVIVLDQLTTSAETAIDRGIGGRLTVRTLGALDHWASHAADLIVVDTHENKEALPPAQRSRGVVVPVGASRAWFAEPTRRAEGTMRVVFFGLYTPLQGTPYIVEAASLASSLDIEFTLIGNGQEFEAARAFETPQSRIHWLDWVDSADLPGVVAAHDVCLGIFGTTDKAMRVVPNKVYQGAAAGCAVITSDTPPQRRALGSSALLVNPGDAHALMQALSSLAADRQHLWNMRKAAYHQAVTHFAPEVVTKRLLAVIEARGLAPGEAASTS